MFELFQAVLTSGPLSLVSSLLKLGRPAPSWVASPSKTTSSLSPYSSPYSSPSSSVSDLSSIISSPYSSVDDLSLPSGPLPGQEFYLPDLIDYCPFELKVNPHYISASQESDRWFDSFGIHKGTSSTLSSSLLSNIIFSSKITSGLHSIVLNLDFLLLCPTPLPTMINSVTAATL